MYAATVAEDFPMKLDDNFTRYSTCTPAIAEIFTTRPSKNYINIFLTAPSCPFFDANGMTLDAHTSFEKFEKCFIIVLSASTK